MHFSEGKQTYFDVEFSKSGNSLVLTALGPKIPRVDIYSWNVTKDQSIKLTWQYEWEANKDISELLEMKKTPRIIHKDILLDSGFTAKVMMAVPPGVDLTGAIKYPMLVDVYGGPDSYSVIDKWSMDWGSFLAANRSVIYTKIDGRGSGLRGDKLLQTIYRKLGTYEIQDQIQVTQ